MVTAPAGSEPPERPCCNEVEQDDGTAPLCDGAMVLHGREYVCGTCGARCGRLAHQAHWSAGSEPPDALTEAVARKVAARGLAYEGITRYVAETAIEVVRAHYAAALEGAREEAWSEGAAAITYARLPYPPNPYDAARLGVHGPANTPSREPTQHDTALEGARERGPTAPEPAPYDATLHHLNQRVTERRK